MIKFITDTKCRETPFQDSVFTKDLLITDLDQVKMFSIPVPDGGWSHNQLEEVAELIYSDAVYYAMTRMGADAYLGDAWVGSTEV